MTDIERFLHEKNSQINVLTLMSVVLDSSSIVLESIKVLEQLWNRIDQCVKFISLVESRYIPLQLREDVRLTARKTMDYRCQSRPVVQINARTSQMSFSPTKLNETTSAIDVHTPVSYLVTLWSYG